MGCRKRQCCNNTSCFIFFNKIIKIIIITAKIHREMTNCKQASRGCIRRSVKMCERQTEKSTPMRYNGVIYSLGVIPQGEIGEAAER